MIKPCCIVSELLIRFFSYEYPLFITFSFILVDSLIKPYHQLKTDQHF